MSPRDRKDDPRAMEKMDAWLAAASAELNLHPSPIVPVRDDVLRLISQVAHGPSRPGAPMTAFLVGYAAGTGMDASEAIAAIEGLISRYESPIDDDAA